MRILFLCVFLFFGVTCFAQPEDCDDQQIYASLQVIHVNCDSIEMEAFPVGDADLQWYVNGTAIVGATGRTILLTEATDGYLIGVAASNNNFCNYTEYLVEIDGGCPVEDCSNGIDDDGNGLIDLNDSNGCDCGPPPEVVGRNLIPNPGFEARRDLPECQGCYSAGQAFPCVSGWIPGNSSTTLEHVLRCYATSFQSRFIPYVIDGSNFSLAGGFAAYDSLDFVTVESAVVPLVEPTIPGERYRLIFETDFVGGDIFDLAERISGDVSQYLGWYTSPVIDSFPYRYSTITGEVVFGSSWDNWTVLDSVVVEINDVLEFETFVIEFTAPTTPIRAMAFAGARNQLRRRELTNLAGDYEAYWVLDNVQLKRILPPVVLPGEIDANVTVTSIANNSNPEDCAADLLLSVPPSNGSSYQWYRNGVALVGSNRPNHLVLASAIDGSLYQVRIVREGTCKTSAPVSARLPEPFEIGFTIDSLRCGANTDGRIMVTVTPAEANYDLNWQGASGENLGNANQIEGLSSGTYFLTVSDEFGCNYPYVFELVAPPPLVAQLTAEDLNCNASDGQAPLNLVVTGGSPPYALFYNNEAGEASRPLRRPPGSYRIRIVDATGCEIITETVTVNEPNPFSFEISSTSTSFQLGSSANVRTISNRDLSSASIQWTPEAWVSCQNCLDPLIRPTESETLRVVVTDSDGCVRSDSIAIRVIPTRQIYIPSAISPNGDGVNDVFRVYPGPSVEAVISVEIFDRWGSLLFTGSRGSTDWSPDGEVPQGVFIYQATVRFVDGEIRNYSGSVTVLR
ncbi:T9SS type B sorting domain-containing protein [Neolewinella persica]|uniref:T9SS type B sorting domain-containing protein n=1 Tax=Neolewinella persica TaxID=70998 RepID=UPI00036401D0|nr:gliding motility-associated C-terminal domain-containing protein [Neolewinella persica]